MYLKGMLPTITRAASKTLLVLSVFFLFGNSQQVYASHLVGQNEFNGFPVINQLQEFRNLEELRQLQLPHSNFIVKEGYIYIIGATGEQNQGFQVWRGIPRSDGNITDLVQLSSIAGDRAGCNNNRAPLLGGHNRIIIAVCPRTTGSSERNFYTAQMLTNGDLSSWSVTRVPFPDNESFLRFIERPEGILLFSDSGMGSRTGIYFNPVSTTQGQGITFNWRLLDRSFTGIWSADFYKGYLYMYVTVNNAIPKYVYTKPNSDYSINGWSEIEFNRLEQYHLIWGGVFSYRDSILYFTASPFSHGDVPTYTYFHLINTNEDGSPRGTQLDNSMVRTEQAHLTSQRFGSWSDDLLFTIGEKIYAFADNKYSVSNGSSSIMFPSPSPTATSTPTPLPTSIPLPSPTPSPTPIPRASLTVSPTVVQTGSTATISWGNIPNPTGLDWVRIFNKANNQAGYWIFVTTCSQRRGTADDAKASGSCSFPLPISPGNYGFKLYPNNTNQAIATSNTVAVNQSGTFNIVPGLVRMSVKQGEARIIGYISPKDTTKEYRYLLVGMPTATSGITWNPSGGFIPRATSQGRSRDEKISIRVDANVAPGKYIGTGVLKNVADNSTQQFPIEITVTRR